MVPDRMAWSWIRSIGVPEGGIRVIVPTPRCAGLALHCDAGVIVPTASKVICAAFVPTSCIPEFVKMLT